MIYPIDGLWSADIGNGTAYPIHLPGTLDENQIGGKDTGDNQWHPAAELGNANADFDASAAIATRFTRKFTFEGAARLTKRISFVAPIDKRVFLEAERAKCLKLLIDGREVPDFIEPSITTPHVFEVTNLLNGDNELTLISDNSYPGLPHDAIVFSSAATDETQTNWNGILGYLHLRVEESVFISALRVYPKQDTLSVVVEISADKSSCGTLTLNSEALSSPVTQEYTVPAGISEIVIDNIPLAENVRRWDEFEGNLYELTASLSNMQSKTTLFGVRDFTDNGKGRLALNGRTIFIRSESNCAEFPETGYPPMTVKEWRHILAVYQAYGVNCMRFHSHCPPEAAFTAADQIGMLMQPELSHWNPNDAFESDESFSYYQTELKQIILWLANHPSFVMLTLGNELCTHELGHERMTQLMDEARAIDTTRLYANGSNVHYGTVGYDQNSDFYASQKYYELDLRGTFTGMGSKEKIGIAGYINNQYPNAQTNFDHTMEKIREGFQKPVFTFEVGQYEILPDFSELEHFYGISDPANLRLIQERVEKQGLSEVWHKYIEATGELSRIGYREEVEAVLRTEQLSGISLLGLQDFPGQGTALVGMLNSHLHPKPFAFAESKRFCSFFCPQLPLVLLSKYTYENTETLSAAIKVANYGKQALEGSPTYTLSGEDILLTGTLPSVSCPVGGLTKAGTLEIPLSAITKPTRLDLAVSVGNVSNTYPIWVYCPTIPKCPDNVYETKSMDEKAKAILEQGGVVYLSPDSTKETLSSSIQAQFTTDFWSVGTFPTQEGGMGQLIDTAHPLFKNFPTENHNNWQWWPMASQRAVILPHTIQSIVTEMDSYAYLRPMAKLFECQCGNGKVLFSSMGLQNLQQYPEARALLTSIYTYLGSDEFLPKQEISCDTLSSLIKEDKAN